MKNIIILLIIVFIFASCAPTEVNSEADTLPKNEVNSTNVNDVEHSVLNPKTSESNKIENDAFYNEISQKMPKLYEGLLPKLQKLGYSQIIMKKQPFIGFRVEHNGMEWIVKSFMKRRKYLLDRIALMLTQGFMKFFAHEGIKVIFSDEFDENSAKTTKTAQSADAILVVESRLNVRPLKSLSFTGMEYLLRLEYNVKAHLVDLKKGSKVWIGTTDWKRNLLATSMD